MILLYYNFIIILFQYALYEYSIDLFFNFGNNHIIAIDLLDKNIKFLADQVHYFAESKRRASNIIAEVIEGKEAG